MRPFFMIRNNNPLKRGLKKMQPIKKHFKVDEKLQKKTIVKCCKAAWVT